MHAAVAGSHHHDPIRGIAGVTHEAHRLLVRSRHDHRLQRGLPPGQTHLPDHMTLGVQAQQLAELAQQLVVRGQPGGAVGKYQRHAFHQRADIEKRRCNQTPWRTPGLAFVFRDHQIHRAARPAADGDADEIEAQASLRVAAHHGIAQFADITLEMPLREFARHRCALGAPCPFFQRVDGGIDGHVRRSLAAASVPEGHEPPARDFRGGSAVHRLRCAIGKELSLVSRRRRRRGTRSGLRRHKSSGRRRRERASVETGKCQSQGDQRRPSLPSRSHSRPTSLGA